MHTLPLLFNDVDGYEVLVIILVVLIFFGPKSIPGIAKTLGRALFSIRNASEELKNEIIYEVLGVIRREFSKPTKKEFYSLEEVSVITGLTKSSIKGRYRRGTIERVYSGNKPLIPAKEVEKLIFKLNQQSTKNGKLVRKDQRIRRS